MTDDRIKAVIDNLSSLIVEHSGMLAHEQYRPRLTPDESDEYIAEKKKWVSTLRALREQFENLVTGVL